MSSILSLISSYLPQHEGLLPKWLLFVSLVSILNSVQAYTTTAYTSRVYEGPRPSPASSSTTTQNSKPTPAPAYPSTSPVTPLSSRTFGTWTLVQSIVRFYAAYHISNPQIYALAYWTYVIAFAHFMSEWFYFRTARWGAGLAGPVIVATASLVWMAVQWGFYVG